MKKITTDLLVIGAGGSGLISAVKAAEISGKHVTVIEASKKPGGSTYFAHGFGSWNSSRHKARGLADMSDQMFSRTMKTLWWRANPKLIRRFVNSSGDMLDWILDKGSLDGGESPIVYTENGPMRGFGIPERYSYKDNPDPSIGPGWMGSFVVDLMLKQCEKLGIDVLCQTRAKSFVKDGKKVTGAVCDTPDGQLEISFNACVMAAGGFGANREMLAKRWPEFFDDGNRIHVFSVPTNQGDSINMAKQSGAKVDMKNVNIMVGGPAHHPYSYSIYRIMRQPEIVYINLEGKRWIDETESLEGSYFCMNKQPEALCWAIADENVKEMLGERLIANPPDGSDLPVLQKFREDIEKELAHPYATKKADTLEDLAVQMGVDPATFTAEIAKYNEFCSQGRDADFGKKKESLIPIEKGPFYAFWGQRFSETTHGGIVIDENMRVLADGGAVMEGLYAAGDNSSGWADDQPMPAISPLTWCVHSGYMAGESVGEYLK